MENILLLVPMLHQGGFERVCVQTARLLQDRYNVTVAIFSDRDIHYDVSGLNVVNLDCDVVKGRVAKAFNVMKRVKKLNRLKKDLDIDLTYSFGESANIVNALSAPAGKIVTGLRCSTDMESERFVRMFSDRSDTVIACSKEIGKELSEKYGCKNTAVLYNPLDAEGVMKASFDCPEEDDLLRRIEELRASGSRVIVSMGRDDIIKGFWHLIKAFSIIRREGIDASLVIMGAGSFDRARKLSEELGVGNDVIFAGVKSNPFPYVAAADLYALSSNHEGFPNALMEAMALKKPVVAADCRTGPREILMNDDEWEEEIREITIAPYGMIIPDMDGREDYDASNISADDETLAKALKKALLDEDLLAVMGEHAYTRASQFTKERYRDGLTRIIEETLKR